jgi:hypothetical protein
MAVALNVIYRKKPAHKQVLAVLKWDTGYCTLRYVTPSLVVFDKESGRVPQVDKAGVWPTRFGKRDG